MADQDGENFTPRNVTMFQAFEWNVPSDGKHFQRLYTAAEDLKSIGIDNLWLPPACKASGPNDNGYGIYDLYDIGEFEQKGSRSTKWGTKEDLLKLSDKCDELGMGLLWDAVPNHKAAADRTEMVRVIEVDCHDRTKQISDVREIEAWVGYDFPGRGEKYSKQKYHWYHFSGADYDQKTGSKGIYKFLGENKGWSESVDTADGNADYMMFANLDYSHPEVVEDVKNWGEWIVNQTRIKGFRLDAVQHYSQRFTNDWIKYVDEKTGPKFYVGEFWVGDVERMVDWLEKMESKIWLYDSPIVYNFSKLSRCERSDLRKVFNGSLVQAKPEAAVTQVMNHDTQPGQTVDTPIEAFFKPLAYCLILLRQEGYPCVFYGDIYGMQGRYQEPPSCGGKLPDLVLARKLYAYGHQDDYFDEPNCIGWVRRGTYDMQNGLACIMSNTGPAQKRMHVGGEHVGEIWTDILGWQGEEVRIDEEGRGLFRCAGTSVSVWVCRDAKGREQFPPRFVSNIYPTQDGQYD